MMHIIAIRASECYEKGEIRMRNSMPPKLTPEGVKKIAIVVGLHWLDKIQAWRRHQADFPNMSEAIRRLVEKALADEKPAKKSKKGR